MNISSVIDQNKQKNNLKTLKLSLLVIVIILLAFVFFSDNTPIIAKDELWIEKVQLGEVIASVNGNGVITAKNERLLLSNQPGIITEIMKEDGETVKVGEPILTLSNLKLNKELRQATFALQQLNIKKHETVLKNNNDKSKIIEDINIAKDKLILAEIEDKANKTLVRKNIISQLSYQKKSIAFNQAKRQLSALQVYLSEQLMPLWKIRLKVIDAKIKQAQLTKEELETSINGLIIRSNINGTIVSLGEEIKLGAHITAGKKIANIANLENMKVKLQVAAQRASNLVSGMPVTLNFFDGSFNGVVTKVSPDTKNGQIDLAIEIEKPYPDNLKLGLSVTGEIELGKYSNVLYIPRPINMQKKRNMILYKLQDYSTLYATNVSFGESSEKFIIINKGLAENDKVVLSDLSQYKSSDTIKIDN